MSPARLPWLILLSCAGCTLVGEDELYTPIDLEPPRVEAVIPQDGWIQVPSGITIQLWFSEPLDPASAGAGSVWLWSGERVERGYTRVGLDRDGRGLLEFEPLAPLLPGVRYHLWVGGPLADRYGNRLSQPLSLVFTTAR